MKRQAGQRGSKIERKRGTRQAAQPDSLDPQLKARLRHVRLFLCDVDGVMTDGHVWMSEHHETKRFHIQDGLGLMLLRRCGIKVGWVSARPSPATSARALDLKIDYLHQERGSKVAAAEKILREAGMNWSDVCFVGDDVVDLCLLKRAGVAVAVANAIPEVKAIAHYVTTAPGGYGGIREIVTLIMKAQGFWAKLVEDFTE